MTLMTDLNTLEPTARQTMETVLSTLTSVTSHGKKNISLRPAVFGQYVNNALLGDTTTRPGCAAVMDVLFDMGTTTYFVPSDWERIQFPKVMDMTRDETMCEQAKSTGTGFISSGGHILRLEGFYIIRAKGLDNTVVRCYRLLTQQRMNDHKVLADMLKGEMLQVAFNGESVTMSKALESEVKRKATRAKPHLTLVPKLALSA